MHHSHNEYFGRASNKKICDCKNEISSVYFWGSYVCKIFHNTKYFCEKCFEESVRNNLIIHQQKNNCSIRILGFRKERLPFFIMNLKNELSNKAQVFLPIAEPVFIKENKTVNNNSGLLFQL